MQVVVDFTRLTVVVPDAVGSVTFAAAAIGQPFVGRARIPDSQ